MMVYDSDVLSKYFIDKVFILVPLFKYNFTHNFKKSAFKGIINEDMFRTYLFSSFEEVYKIIYFQGRILSWFFTISFIQAVQKMY